MLTHVSSPSPPHSVPSSLILLGQDGGAPWSPPLGALLLGGAAYALSSRDDATAATLRNTVGVASLDLAEQAKGAADQAVDDAKTAAQAKVGLPVTAQALVPGPWFPVWIGCNLEASEFLQLGERGGMT